MRYFLSLICLISATMLQAQDATENTFEQPKFILKYTPTSLLNVVTPGIQLGLEQHLENNRALLYEASFLNDFGLYQSYIDDLSGYRIKVEYRTYKNDLDFGKNKFSGWVLEGKQRFMENEYRYPNTVSSDFNYSDKLYLTEMTSSVSVYYTRGLQWFYKNNFTFEIAAGIGARILNTAVLNAPDGLDVTNLDAMSTFKLDVGRTIPLPVGFFSMRIGYAF